MRIELDPVQAEGLVRMIRAEQLGLVILHPSEGVLFELTEEGQRRFQRILDVALHGEWDFDSFDEADQMVARLGEAAVSSYTERHGKPPSKQQLRSFTRAGNGGFG